MSAAAALYLCLGGTGKQEVLGLSNPHEGAGSTWFHRLMLSLRLGRDEPPLLRIRRDNTEEMLYIVNLALERKGVYIYLGQICSLTTL